MLQIAIPQDTQYEPYTILGFLSAVTGSINPTAIIHNWTIPIPLGSNGLPDGVGLLIKFGVTQPTSWTGRLNFFCPITITIAFLVDDFENNAWLDKFPEAKDYYEIVGVLRREKMIFAPGYTINLGLFQNDLDGPTLSQFLPDLRPHCETGFFAKRLRCHGALFNDVAMELMGNVGVMNYFSGLLSLDWGDQPENDLLMRFQRLALNRVSRKMKTLS
jgi:hypothetical protein